jgi:serine protease Do
MNRVSKSLTVALVGGGSLLGAFFGTTVVQNVRFAQAAEQVQASREQLAHVDSLASVFREIGKAVEPSVVKIDVRKSAGAGNRQLPFDDEMLKRFFPDNNGDGQPDVPEDFGNGEGFGVQGTGSGVIMETQGGTAFIVTNNHVAGGASEIHVTLADGRTIDNGKVVGTDAKTDLAVIKIEADRVIPAAWGDSDELQKGDWIMAFGSPFGYVGSMTHGIVSALNRQAGILGQHGYESFIQVDAPINPGNSGGPLVNVKGQVVGINTAIATRSGGFQGIGFAIPSNQAKFVYAALKEKGKVTRGWLGVSIRDVAQDAAGIQQAFNYSGTTGVFVHELLENAPVAGKLQRGDIITEMNGKPVKTVQELRNTIAATPPNSELKLKVFRGGKLQDTTIRIGEQPENLEQVSLPGGRNRPGTPGAPRESTTELRGMTLSNPTEELAQKFGLSAEQRKGAVVTEVKPRSAAAKAGLRVGDVITEVAGKPVSTAKEAADAVAKQEPGKILLLYVTSSTPGGSRFVFVEPQK